MQLFLFQFIVLSIFLNPVKTYVVNGGDEKYRSFSFLVLKDTAGKLRIALDTIDLEILPPSSGINFYKEGIIFLSSTKLSDDVLNDHTSFGKIRTFYGTPGESAIMNTQAFSENTDFPYPVEATSFTSDFRTMFYAKYSKNEGVEKIYMANLTTENNGTDDWRTDENPLVFCTGKFVYTHPAVSHNGRMIVFASDMDGTTGGMDLFFSLYKDGSWSSPENLGNAINTSVDELFPYLDAQNNLYFSSNGILGFGGFDVFVCKFKGSTWEAPVNLSTPVNTVHDDIAFKLSPDEKTAYFTVSKHHGKGPVTLIRAKMDEGDATREKLTLSECFTSSVAPKVVFYSLLTPFLDEKKNNKKTSVVKSNYDNIVYRVQFLNSLSPKTRSQIILGGKQYDIFEYLYSGTYRQCVGEFASTDEAEALLDLLTKSDYPEAFVVAFSNKNYSLDPRFFNDKSGVKLLVRKDSEMKADLPEKIILAETKDVAGAPDGRNTSENKTAQKTDKGSEQLTALTALKNRVNPENTTNQPAKSSVVSSNKATQAAKGPEDNKSGVVYRIQLLSTVKPKGSYKIRINNSEYDTFEYLYSGAYRTCVGEFRNLKQAVELQGDCRKAGFQQAFVVAFRNNVRTTEPALFR